MKARFPALKATIDNRRMTFILADGQHRAAAIAVALKHNAEIGVDRVADVHATSAGVDTLRPRDELAGDIEEPRCYSFGGGRQALEELLRQADYCSHHGERELLK